MLAKVTDYYWTLQPEQAVLVLEAPHWELSLFAAFSRPGGASTGLMLQNVLSMRCGYPCNQVFTTERLWTRNAIPMAMVDRSINTRDGGSPTEKR